MPLRPTHPTPEETPPKRHSKRCGWPEEHPPRTETKTLKPHLQARGGLSGASGRVFHLQGFQAIRLLERVGRDTWRNPQRGVVVGRSSGGEAPSRVVEGGGWEHPRRAVAQDRIGPREQRRRRSAHPTVHRAGRGGVCCSNRRGSLPHVPRYARVVGVPTAPHRRARGAVHGRPRRAHAPACSHRAWPASQMSGGVCVASLRGAREGHPPSEWSLKTRRRSQTRLRRSALDENRWEVPGVLTTCGARLRCTLRKHARGAVCWIKRVVTVACAVVVRVRSAPRERATPPRGFWLRERREGCVRLGRPRRSANIHAEAKRWGSSTWVRRDALSKRARDEGWVAGASHAAPSDE